MIERPILFNGEMVRAILEGRKTQTRRVVRGIDHDLEDLLPVVRGLTRRRCGDAYGDFIECPYGQTGDRLWVRENFIVPKAFDYTPPRFLDADDVVEYPADRCLTVADGRLPDRGRCRPSIHLPRKLSRILLGVVSVRVERVQDITEEDAELEGSPVGRALGHGRIGYGRIGYETHREGFINLWDSINGKPGEGGVDVSWAANPWVWVVDFKRVVAK